MEFAVLNYFHIANARNWRCHLYNMRPAGTVTIMVFPDPPVRSRMHIEITDVIYLEMYVTWRGCELNVASSAELRMFIPRIGTHLRQELSDEYIFENYRLFVFPSSEMDMIFLARDANIAQLLP